MFKIALQSAICEDVIHSAGPYEAVRKAKEIGYNEIEISGHYHCDDEFVDAFYRGCKDFDMHVCAISIVFNGQYNRPNTRNFEPNILPRDIDKMVGYARKLDCKYFRYAGMPDEITTWEDLETYCKLLEETCVELDKHGMKLCMHNHDGEFYKINGKTMFEWTTILCPHLCYEFDYLGAQRAGMDTYEVMGWIKGRMPLIHFEDMKCVKAPKVNGQKAPLEDRVVGCGIGDGNVNLVHFCQVAADCGNEYFINEVSKAAKLKEFGLDAYDVMRDAAIAMRAAGFDA